MNELTQNPEIVKIYLPQGECAAELAYHGMAGTIAELQKNIYGNENPPDSDLPTASEVRKIELICQCGATSVLSIIGKEDRLFLNNSGSADDDDSCQTAFSRVIL